MSFRQILAVSRMISVHYKVTYIQTIHRDDNNDKDG
jgi:hypothetical protein